MSFDVIDEQFLPLLICHICSEVIEKAITLICCSSSFCEKCIKTYLQFKNQCPVCNMTVNTSSEGFLKRDKLLQNIIHNILPQKKLSTTAKDSEFSDERLETYQLFIEPCENAEDFIKEKIYEEVKAKLQPFCITVNASASVQSLESLIQLKFSRIGNKEDSLQVSLYHDGTKLPTSRTLKEVFQSKIEKIKMVKFTAIKLKKSNFVGIFREFLLEKNNLKIVKQTRELEKRNVSRKKPTKISKVAKAPILKKPNLKASYLVEQFKYFDKKFNQPLSGNTSNDQDLKATVDENLSSMSMMSNNSSLISMNQEKLASLTKEATTSSFIAKNTNLSTDYHQNYIKDSFGYNYSQSHADEAVKDMRLQHPVAKYNPYGVSLEASNIGPCTTLVNSSIQQSPVIIPQAMNRGATFSNQMMSNYQSPQQFAAFSNLPASRISAPFPTSTSNAYSNVQNTIALQMENYYLKYQVGALYNQLLLSSQNQANQHFASHHSFRRNQINSIQEATNAGLSNGNHFEITHQEDCNKRSFDIMERSLLTFPPNLNSMDQNFVSQTK